MPSWTICILAGMLALPAAASADSVSISAPAEGVVGGKTTISVAVEVAGDGPRDLTVVRKRVEDAACGATEPQDDAASEHQKFVGAEFRIGAGSHTYTYETEWAEKPGQHRFCAWVANNQSPYETTAVAPEALIDVRAPKASIEFTRLKRGRLWVDAGYITTGYTVSVAGTREMPSSVTGVWRKNGACPPDADSGIDNRTIDFGSNRAAGPFSLRGHLGGPDLVLGRPWVFCVYVFATYVDEPVAVARTVVEPKTKPLIEGRPGIGSDSVPDRKLTCLRGHWAAYPRKIRFSYRWWRNGRRMRTRAAAIRVGDRNRGDRFSCEVTARNALGTTRKRSPAYRIY